MILTQDLDKELYPWQQQRVKQMAQELAESAGIDWHFNYRWMQMSEENYLLARLKYTDILGLFGIRQNGTQKQKHS
jgi:hypothetical protein